MLNSRAFEPRGLKHIVEHLIRHLCRLRRRMFHVGMLYQARDHFSFGRHFLLAHEGLEHEIEHISNRHIPNEAAAELEGLVGVMDQLIAKELFDPGLPNPIDSCA